MKILNNLDLSGNQLLNGRLHFLPTGSIPAPGASTSGRIGYDSTLNLPFWLNSSAINYLYPMSTSAAANTAVLRDGSGNFSAGTITATLSGNASTASALQTARTISLTGGASGSTSFNGSANVSISVTVTSVPISAIPLSNGNFLRGNGSNVAAEATPGSIPISVFGAATSNINLGGNKVLNSASITAADSGSTLVNKDYVDSIAQGLDTKPEVRAATTVNITLSGAQTVDGVALVAGDTVLVKNQINAAQNGIWIVQSGAWTRPTYADIWDEIVSAYVFVQEGTVNDNTGWVCTANRGYYVLGTDPNSWVQFAGASTYTPGRGMNLQGTVINFGTANADYTVNSIPYANAGTTIAFTNAPSQFNVLVAGAGGVPTFAQINLASSAAVGSSILPLSNGGTGAALTASNGGIVYSGSSSFAVLAGTATANRLLMSGSSAAPSWSTATYPGSAGTAGTFIRSDGSNWVNSVLSLPNSGVTNSLLWISSTNTVGTLASSNNSVLVTNGTGVPAFSAASSNQVLRADGSGNVAFGQINIASGSAITGVLPVANGGTGASTFTANALIYGNATGSLLTLGPHGGTRQFVTQASSASPTFFDLFGSTNVWTAVQTFRPSTTPTDAIVIDIAALVSAGTRDSNYLLFTGRSYDTVAHNVDWRLFNGVTSNAGASTFRIQERIDAASFADIVSFSSKGDMYLYTDKTAGGIVTLGLGGPATGLSLSLNPGLSTNTVRASLYLTAGDGPVAGVDPGGHVYICGGSPTGNAGRVILGSNGTLNAVAGGVSIPYLVNGRPLWCSDANGGIYSYDLFGSSNTWTGVQTLTSPRVLNGIFDDVGGQIFGWISGSGSVDHIKISNSVGSCSIAASGTSANINLSLSPKGTGSVVISGVSYPSGLSANRFLVSTAANAVTSIGTPSSLPGVPIFDNLGVPSVATPVSSQSVLIWTSGSGVSFGQVALGSSAAVVGVLGSANGGTGVAFFGVSGPTALRTYTFPDANASIVQRKLSAIPTGLGTTITVAHGMGHSNVIAQVIVGSAPGSGETTGDYVYPDVRVDSTNITLVFASQPALNQYVVSYVG